ncbi:MAG: SMC-Scp complex subunit ScpB [Candidatus Omnitrophica bacterium]|nr:SMC-Scp complex subunit ScpB [Candidatus Omnitrophota bacterium]MBU4478371.1 SMC-Scp complex subunit ScpB [Candidatus Omnitrophota bacterium]MCG2703962.1 SMC-Scp complex subunit ScpB [Candidatus Omnitrophota bacterium]
MDDLDLKKVVEALLFVSEKPLALKQVAEVCEGVESSRIKSILNSLKDEYNTVHSGVHVFEVAGGYQFSSNPDCADYLKKLYKTRRVFRLSAPSLETLAIIAYKQPVTRAEIEFIRGVNIDGVVKTLEERNLIKEKGRKDVPGRPILYGTTEEFLHYFGLKSIDELPKLEDFAALSLERAAQEEPESAQETPPAQEMSEKERLVSAANTSLNASAQREAGENNEGQDEYTKVAQSD